MVLSSSIHLIDRAWRRIVDIPKRGLPILRLEPAHTSFDQEYGVETSKLVWLTNVSSRNYVHGIRYEACSPVACQWAIEAAGIDYEDYWFMDIGCGKGRPLLIASRYAFPRLIGIDYSARLCEKAKHNLGILHIPEERFEIVCCDATDFKFPEHDLFAYFHNPFDPTILAVVLEHIKMAPNRLIIAYEGPSRAELSRYDWLTPLAHGPNVDLYQRGSKQG